MLNLCLAGTISSCKKTFQEITLLDCLCGDFLISCNFLNALDSGSYKLDAKSASLWAQSSDQDKIGIYVQLLDFNSSSQTLKARIWLRPPEKYAYSLDSSVQVLYDTAIDISASTINYNSDGNVGYWQANQYLRAIDVELDADNSKIKSLYNDKWFPFDRYSVALTGQIRFLVSGSNTDSTKDDVWESLPIGISHIPLAFQAGVLNIN